jgi:hypothetical protein
MPNPVDAHKAPTLLDRFSAWVDGTDLNQASYLTPLDSAFLYGELQKAFILIS